VEDVNHREHAKLPEREEKLVIADIREQLERWLELEEVLPAPWSIQFSLPKLPKLINSFDEIEEVATKLRQHWNLGLNPVTDLIDTIESKGIKVLITQYDGHKHFNGLSARLNKAPVIVVGKTWTGDRQRFTLCHELGHLVLHGRLDELLKDKEEKACDRFAGAFLVPGESVKMTLGERRTRLEPQELYLLKHEWGLSMMAWSFRAKDMNVLPDSGYKELWRKYMRHWKAKEKEPGDPYPAEQTRLFKQLVYRALAEDQLSESKAAELLGMSVTEFHACRKMECPHDVANQ
jgi:Zn-dependent peptidase ImmA (M78 family)